MSESSLPHRLGGPTGQVSAPADGGDRARHSPVSFAQSRIWLLNQITGPDPQYNVPIVLRCRRRVDAGALHAALHDVVLRHETLRTVYRVAGGEVVQQVRPPHAVGEVVTVERHPEPRWAARIGEISAYAFSLDTEIPFRAWLLSSESADVLVLVVHHIATDGSSLAPLLRDLGTAYAARRDRAEPGWKPLPLQYGDYAAWQQDFLGDSADPDSVSGRQLAYWRSRLDRLPLEIALPADRPRPRPADFGGDSVTAPVPAGLHRGILEVARAERVSPFTVLHAAFAAFLGRSGAGADIPLGAFVSGRADAAFDDLVGFFVNTLVLRMDVSGAPTFRELVRRARTVEIEAYAHQDLPFEMVVKELGPDRSSTRHPLVQTAISYEAADQGAPAVPELDAEVEIGEHGRAKFDLYVRFVAARDADGDGDGDGDGEPAALHVDWRYATALFDAATVESMAERFIGFLGAAVTGVDQRIGNGGAAESGGAAAEGPAAALPGGIEPSR